MDFPQTTAWLFNYEAAPPEDDIYHERSALCGCFAGTMWHDVGKMAIRKDCPECGKQKVSDRAMAEDAFTKRYQQAMHDRAEAYRKQFGQVQLGQVLITPPPNQYYPPATITWGTNNTNDYTTTIKTNGIVGFP